MSAEEVLLEVNEDRAYYKSSGGGMTVSGGEPALQKEFLAALLQGAKEMGIHTAVETAGNYPFSNIEPSLPYIDLVLFDVKAFSPGIYERYIHGDREAIFDTLAKLDAAGKRIIARTPVVGGVNDTRGEIEAVAAHVRKLQNLVHYQLIPYHALGNAKREALSEETKDFYTPADDVMAALERAAAKYVPVYNVKRGFIKEEQ
jgi:pyruvate formate lyase activating enzyme